MSSDSSSSKMTGTLWDLVNMNELESKMKQKENNPKKTKRENDDDTPPNTKKNTKETCLKQKEEIAVPEVENIWNLPFKPFLVVPAKEINAHYNGTIRYKLKPHKISAVIDYSNVKSMVRSKDPRLCRDTVVPAQPASIFETF